MKTSDFYLFLLTSLLIFSVISCGSDDMPETGGPFPDPMTAEFNFDFDGAPFEVSSTNIAIDNGFIFIEALSGAGEQVKFAVDNVGVDDYLLQGNWNLASYKSDPDDTGYFGSQFTSEFARLEISTLDYDTKTISGTFNFELAKSDFSGERHSITNGVFNNVPFKMGTEITGTSTMTLSVGNTSFQSEIINATSFAETIYVSGSKADRNDEERFMFIFNQDTDNGNIAMNSFSKPNGRYINNGVVYRAKSSEQMTITNHDVVNKLIEGTFAFELVNEDSNSDLVNAENGTFSISY